MANYAAYNPTPSNMRFNSKTTNFDYSESSSNYKSPGYASVIQPVGGIPGGEYDDYQDHKPYNDKTYQVGMEDVFGRAGCHKGETVGEVFFSEKNVKRLQKQIRNDIYERTKHQYIIDEDQDPNDLLIPMRAIYQLHGRYLDNNIVHQVKDLNKKLVGFVVPDMITQIKQYYDYLKDVNEPLKPIDRPMNVSSAGRRTLPSITTMWSRF